MIVLQKKKKSTMLPKYIALSLLLILISLSTSCTASRRSHRTSRPPTVKERLNRILEKRQAHEYQTRRSFRTLVDHGYNVYDTPIIAGHYRQLRSLRGSGDAFVLELFRQEKARMDMFVEDVNEVNDLTHNALYYSLGEVKDRRWDDLISFLMREIRYVS